VYEIRTTDGELIAEATDGYAVRLALDTLTAEGYTGLVDPFTGRPNTPATDDRTHIASAYRIERHGKAPLHSARCTCGWSTSCTTSSKAEAHGWADAHVRLSTPTTED
jgi:hypothetical protein